MQRRGGCNAGRARAAGDRAVTPSVNAVDWLSPGPRAAEAQNEQQRTLVRLSNAHGAGADEHARGIGDAAKRLSGTTGADGRRIETPGDRDCRTRMGTNEGQRPSQRGNERRGLVREDHGGDKRADRLHAVEQLPSVDRREGGGGTGADRDPPQLALAAGKGRTVRSTFGTGHTSWRRCLHREAGQASSHGGGRSHTDTRDAASTSTPLSVWSFLQANGALAKRHCDRGGKRTWRARKQRGREQRGEGY
ncbi:hypothetical protein ERJ75_001155400 [Trypanosoma vivax]|nr:hypothetical protein ERJ75_001155400 [Trypanosoma vivax]